MTPRTDSVRFGRWGKGSMRPLGPLLIESVATGRGRNSFSVFRVMIKPGESHPPIWHAKTTEFFLVMKGSALARVNGRKRRMKKGDFASLAPGAVHAFKAGPSGVEALVVFIPALDLRRPDVKR